MKLKDIVCDLEYAEKLKELGLVKEGIFKYYNPPIVDNRPYEVSDEFELTDSPSYTIAPHFNPINTYTVAEFGEMLPEYIEYNDTEIFLTSYKVDGSYESIYSNVVTGKEIFHKSDPKEANARAKLLIWLIENKHVNPEEL